MLSRWLCRLFAILPAALAYQSLIEDSDTLRQTCSGMYGPSSSSSLSPQIEILFTPGSFGRVALVVYEFDDAHYLGVPSKDEIVYICTLQAVADSLCLEANLGSFIVTSGANSTSIYTSALDLDATGKSGMIAPISYPVKRSGYYCVGAIPLTTQGSSAGTAQVDFVAIVDFQNVFEGHLPASEWPKIKFYKVLTIIYAVLAAAWAVLCFKNRRDLLAIQHYISATVLFLVFEMSMIRLYYSYLNTGGDEGAAKLLLISVTVLNATRNSLSLFLLLLISMGYGIVRESIGARVLWKVRTLTSVHFVFGILYGLGITTPLDSAGIFVIFFVLPLSLSLTACMMWIISSLFLLIADLDLRRQHYKKQMFTRLYRILVITAIIVATSFFVSAVSFSTLSATIAPPWRLRWVLLDGWLASLYLLTFSSIAFLWRPSPSNKRLAMMSEIAGDEDEADRFDIDALSREGAKDAIPLRGMDDHSVVFDLGAESDEDEGGPGPEERMLRGEIDESDEEAGPPSYQKRSA